MPTYTWKYWDFRSYKLLVWKQVQTEGAWVSGGQETMVTSGAGEGPTVWLLSLCVSCMDLVLHYAEPNGRKLKLKGCPEPAVLGSYREPGWSCLGGGASCPAPPSGGSSMMQKPNPTPQRLSSREQGADASPAGQRQGYQSHWWGLQKV